MQCKTCRAMSGLKQLEKAVQTDPNRVYLRYHMGRILAALQETDSACEQLRLGMFLAKRDGVSNQVRVEGSSCAQVLANIFLTQGRFDFCQAAAAEGLTLYEDNLALEWVRARCLVEKGRNAEAIEILLHRLDFEPEHFFDPALAYQTQLFGELRFSLLGTAYFFLEQYSKAETNFIRAAEYAAAPLEYETKASLARARASTAKNAKQPKSGKN